MKTTKTENETIERYLVDLRMQGHKKGALVLFFRADKTVSHSCDRWILCEKLITGSVLVEFTISIC